MFRSSFGRFAAIIALAAGVVFATGCSQIDTGNVGVARTLGKINMEEVQPGVSFTGISKVSEFTTKEVAFSMNDLRPKAKDNLTIQDLDIDVYFQIAPGQVAETTAKYQGDVVRYRDISATGSGGSELVVGYQRVSREAREAVYRAVGEFPATTMHTKRAELSERIRELLQSELDKSDKGTWTITAINVRTLVTDPAIEKSIRANAETDQQIAQAIKEKELAKAKGQARIEAAEAEATANRIVSASLSPQLIELKRIEAQRAFAGQGTHTVLMGDSAKGASVLLGK